MNRSGEIYLHDKLAGFLSETGEGYIFKYDNNFLKNGIPISFTFPLRSESYFSKKLFSFFEGLLPEGWTLEIYSKVLKIDSEDKFGLLLGTCHDCIGAVSVKEIKNET
jgi:serine/threonine-protein kinase HipA